MKSFIPIALGMLFLSSIPARCLADPVDESPRMTNDNIRTEWPMLASLYPSGVGPQTQKTDSPWDGAAGGALIGGLAGVVLYAMWPCDHCGEKKTVVLVSPVAGFLIGWGLDSLRRQPARQRGRRIVFSPVLSRKRVGADVRVTF